MTVRSRSVASVTLVLVAVLLLGSVASAATFRVRARLTDDGFRWKLKTVSVATGSRVVWKMVDGTHNVTATSKNWSKKTGNIGPGGTTAFTFGKAGTYRYRCTLHSTVANGACSGMCGRVVVG